VTGLIFLNQFFLWLMPLVLLPVAFHLFFKFRKKIEPFPSFMFFYMIDQRFSAKRKIREWLVLCLRILFIFFLLLALSRPVRYGSTVEGGRSSVVLLVDNSGSMSAGKPGAENKLEKAVRAAGALVDCLGENDSGGVVLTVEDFNCLTPSGLSSDKKTLKQVLFSVKPTEAEGDVPGALRKAAAILSKSTATNFEVHVFSDLQRHEWGKKFIGDRPVFPEATRIVLHRLNSPAFKKGNVRILRISPSERRLISGRPFKLETVLENNTVHPGKFQVCAGETDRKNRTEFIEFGANSERTFSDILKTDSNGVVRYQVNLSGDAFAADNTACTAFKSSGKAKVILCGDKKLYGMLPLALNPDGTGELSGLETTFVDLKKLPDALSKNKVSMLVITWDLLANAIKDVGSGTSAKLREYVDSGGNLLLLPGEGTSAGTAGVPVWLQATLGGQIQNATGAALMPFDEKLAFWDDMRSSKGQLLFRNIRAYKYNKLNLNEKYNSLIGLEDGTVLLGQLRYGKGVIFASGLAFSGKWSNLPLKPVFLAMVQGMALGIKTEDNSGIVNLIAGEKIPERFFKGNQPLKVVSRKNGATFVLDKTNPVMPNSGFFEIIRGNQEEAVTLCVSSSPVEGNQNFIRGGSLDMLGGLNYTVRDYEGIAPMQAEFRKRLAGTDFFLPLLILAILILCAEVLLATPGIIEPLAERMKKVFRPRHMTGILALNWHPQISSWVSVLLIGLVVMVIYLLGRLMFKRFSRSRALLLLLPKSLIAVLLLLAMFDPVLIYQRNDSKDRRFLALLDVSDSMKVKDDWKESRRERAFKALDRLKEKLDGRVKLEVLTFDSSLHEPGKAVPEGKRSTDIAGCLSSLRDKYDQSGYQGAVLFTDGGDDIFMPVKMLEFPVYAVGMGTASSSWDDVCISNIQYPETAEKNTDFEIVADVRANAGRDKRNFSPRLRKVKMVLELADKNGHWKEVKEKTADISKGIRRVRFKLKSITPGVKKCRLRVMPVKGELSDLNNQRYFNVNIKSRSLKVLYFSYNLGVNFKYLRRELNADPGISFTAMFRTIRDLYTIQGDNSGDMGEPGSAGVLDDLKKLLQYDCLIIDSVPAEKLSKERQQVISLFVEKGGALILLPGLDSSPVKYKDKPFEKLLPWKLAGSDRGKLEKGDFTVSIPPSQKYHPVLAGVDELLVAEVPSVKSLFALDQVKPGVKVIVEGSAGGIRKYPLLLIASYGKGQVMVFNSDTFWRWAVADSENLRKVYSMLWRQGIRNVIEGDDEGKTFKINWDKKKYSPGDKATGKIIFDKEESVEVKDITASVTYDGKVKMVPVDKDAGGNSRKVSFVFDKRGEYLFHLNVRKSDGVIDAYEKIFSVSPGEQEGSRLELNRDFLKKLTAKGNGEFFTEKDIDKLAYEIDIRNTGKPVVSEISPVYDWPWFLVLILFLGVLDWWFRRKANLI
jgi:uncharacterized membrane protein